jgi:hypothetical protein
MTQANLYIGASDFAMIDDDPIHSKSGKKKSTSRPMIATPNCWTCRTT